MRPAQTTVSIVLVGKFQPADFQLESMKNVQALGVDELGSAAYEALMPNQLAVITLPWGKLAALPERLSVEVSTVPYVRALDLMLKLLREASPSSIVAKYGINTSSNFRFQSMAARDKFAVRMAPPSAWGRFGALIERSFQERTNLHGGVTKLTLRQIPPDDRTAGWTDASLEPSGLAGDDHGVILTINDHYEMSDEAFAGIRGSERARSDELLQSLERNFDKSVEGAFNIGEDVFGNES